MSAVTLDQAARVRFGGTQSAEGFAFELSGGSLCLDFANTLDERRTPRPRELLTGYARLVDWGVQAGAVSSAAGAALLRRAGRHPAAADAALREAIALRETFFLLCSSMAAGRPVPARALSALDRALPRALAARSVRRRGRDLVWDWRRRRPRDLREILWPVVWSAAELLTSAGRLRIRECAGARCRWLFVDASRSGTRRWCDMSVCGNRAKAARHRARRRGRAPSSPPARR